MIAAQQQKILAFPYSKFDALICDGAVRSGKTTIMMWAFVKWAMDTFNGRRFGICGRTVDSCTKNIIIPFTTMTIAQERYVIRWRRLDKVMEVRRNGITNYFEVFGGKDESSYTLIQGRTFAGVLLDEVVLMPRSFVEQALARCSVDGAKMWFNCNPDTPGHWFYNEWIQKAKEKNALHLHFSLEDNPSLSEKTVQRYKTMYSGVFYQRYILGEWVAAQGLIYDCFNAEKNTYTDLPLSIQEDGIPYYSGDYGTSNPTAFLKSFIEWENARPTIYIEDEYYYNSRETLRQKSDAEYVADFHEFTKGERYREIILDPAASSLIVALQQDGYVIKKANNDVLDGIRLTYLLMSKGRIKINRENCPNLLKELSMYKWEEKSKTGDKPIKENDHACDALRYLIKTVIKKWVFRTLDEEE